MGFMSLLTKKQFIPKSKGPKSKSKERSSSGATHFSIMGDNTNTILKAQRRKCCKSEGAHSP
jgi:hypothetical protein